MYIYIYVCVSAEASQVREEGGGMGIGEREPREKGGKQVSLCHIDALMTICFSSLILFLAVNLSRSFSRTRSCVRYVSLARCLETLSHSLLCSLCLSRSLSRDSLACHPSPTLSLCPSFFLSRARALSLSNSLSLARSLVLSRARARSLHSFARSRKTLPWLLGMCTFERKSMYYLCLSLLM